MEYRYTIKGVATQLHRKLREYLETQYPISNPELQEKRTLLLNSPRVISSEPFIEATPIYEKSGPYEEMSIPDASKRLMTRLSSLSPGVGVFPQLYVHQQWAMEAFFHHAQDLVVATGTGSGKTETFMYPILNSLYLEAEERPNQFSKRAVRALILYPMNALVSDQMTRLRRLYRDERVKQIFREVAERNVQFGMYTSRTPFAGSPKKSKVDRLLKVINEYLELEEKHPNTVSQMKERGKWIAKDLVRFKESLIELGKTNQITVNPYDAELYARYEMQCTPPDILVTNYSMLEYMLIRPIERSIWQMTREWLQSDERNTFLLILDEAHMYRGTSGAEVAYLIRRLQSRLGIPRDRMRCILTSASIGSKDNEEEKALIFAEKLTGKLAQRSFKFIKGKPEKRSPGRAASLQEVEALNLLDSEKFLNYSKSYESFLDNFQKVRLKLNWAEPPASYNDFPRYLYEQLRGFGPFELIFQSISGHARSIKEIASNLCPDSDPNSDPPSAEIAASHLLMMASLANYDGSPLLAARVHMFYRGVSGIFICLNPNCNVQSGNEKTTRFGKMYDSYRLTCDCGARVFEVVTHKKCGSAFIRGYYKPGNDEFYLWGEEGSGLIDEDLEQIDLLIDEPHKEVFCSTKKLVIPLWIDITTGYILKDAPAKSELNNYQKVYAYPNMKKNSQGPYASSFLRCPCCLNRSDRGIMDLRTKGEQPFANLVREQFNLQPPVHGKNHPNEGRKVLLFSDGRQKAARLARDIPNEVEKDTLRQLLLLAAYNTKYKYSIGKMYAALLHFMRLHNVLLFDKNDRNDLLSDIGRYEYMLDTAIEEVDVCEILEEIDGFQLKGMIRKRLIEVIASPGISLYDTTTGFVVPTKYRMNKLRKELHNIFTEDQLRVISVMFIKEMLDDIAIDPLLTSRDRREILGYARYREDWGYNQNDIPESIEKLVGFLGKGDMINVTVDHLYKNLCSQEDGRYYLDLSNITICNGIEHTWYKCDSCKQIHAFTLDNHCPNCWSVEIIVLLPNSPVLASEKGYWRTPIMQVLYDNTRVRNMTVEEHTAQLSQKDDSSLFATTERYELAFQDIPIPSPDGDGVGIVDILSCTTTMEVGIDIGSLTAVGLRNIPPQRENYQQRAGRAGRRGSSLSTVVTYAQDGPHDHHYFSHPDAIISGPPSESNIYIENEKIIRRHVISVLIQTYFHEHASTVIPSGSKINESLGRTIEFFKGDPPFNLQSFENWLKGVSYESHLYLFSILSEEFEDLSALVNEIIQRLPIELKNAFEKIRHEVEMHEQDNEESFDIEQGGNYFFLEFLFNHGFLPTYAFPRDLVSLYIQDRRNGKIYLKQRPQLELNRALSEYSPGRQVVVDKETYRIGGIYNPYAPDKSKPVAHYSFENTVAYCDKCQYTRLGISGNEHCPTCNSNLKKMPFIRPEGFSPEKGVNVERWDDEDERSYASMPLFPVPNRREELGQFINLGTAGGIQYVYTSNKELIVLNRGIDDESGFVMCEECGFIRPIDSSNNKSLTPHDKPFLTGFGDSKCRGKMHNVFLGNKFITDLLLIRLRLDDTLNFNPQGNNPWLSSALDSLGEAIVIAASRVLDIDVRELVTGYRIITENKRHYADLYVFDSLSGGAGYSYAAGQRIEEILSMTEYILSNCEGKCKSSCYKCLRHYKNQLKHFTLNRFIALELLEYLKDGKMRRYSLEEQKEYFNPLLRICEILRYRLNVNVVSGNLELETENGKKVMLRNNIEKPPIINDEIMYFSPSEIAFDLEKVALLVTKK